MQRRSFLLGAGSALAGGAMPRPARANVPKPYNWDIAPPMDNREAYIGWMVANRGEDPRFLGSHWARYQALVANKDVLDDRNKRAFLLVPREEFVLKPHLGRPYHHELLARHEEEPPLVSVVKQDRKSKPLKSSHLPITN